MKIFNAIIKNGKDTLRMISIENMMKEGRLLAHCTQICHGEDKYKAMTLENEF